VGALPTWREPRLVGGQLFWLERRPQEQGRTTLLMRPAADRDALPRELTPPPWNLRTRLHGYGGGVFTSDGTTVVFVHDGDRQLWRLDLADPLGALPAPQRLTAPPDPAQGREGLSQLALGDGLIDGPRKRWVGVMEADGRDQLVAVSLAGGGPQTLHLARDFCSSPTLSPSGSHLAWLEWQQPFMPWERSQLWIGRFDDAGSLTDVRCLAGADGSSAKGESVFQPLWAGPDLVIASDGNGWWNLRRFANAEQDGGTGALVGEPLLEMEAEFGVPQWIAGLRTTAWDGEQLVAAACRHGMWELGRLARSSAVAMAWQWQPMEVPFTDLAELCAEKGRLVALASAPQVMEGLLEIDLGDNTWAHTPTAASPLPPEEISLPEALWFTGADGEPTHAWFYPPSGGSAESPLLIRAHSGPTGMARTGLNLMVQFWTSRGWGVVDVNYGGSSGFGRAYRERLQGQWGVLDVVDCLAAAAAVVASGRAAPERVAMDGSSASAFTVLAALAADGNLRAGACRYPVTDLEALAQEGHRFEAHYLDGLVGPLPEARAIYQARSPLQQVGRIRRPLILFHGLDDTVVPPAQSERLALALSEQGVPVEIFLFPGEGHGFRSGVVQAQVLEATEAFFRRHLGLPR
jgi:acetyl esterase/lipase